MSTRIGVSLSVVAVLVAACVPPAAQAAKPKLYSVSLTGSVHNERTAVFNDAVQAPYGCVGSMSETRHFAASANIRPKGGAAPVASYGRLIFRARLKAFTASSTSETSGSFSPDPDFPPPDPSDCAVAPERKSYPCHFRSEATRRSGGEFALFPEKGRYQLYYNRSAGILLCDDNYFYDSLLDTSPEMLTKLHVRAVRGLRRHRSVSASGTISSAPVSGETGGETLHYALKVTRVR
jgi:hypothetical protein